MANSRQLHAIRRTLLATFLAAAALGSAAPAAPPRRSPALANISADQRGETSAADRVVEVSFRDEGRNQNVAGRMLIEAADGGMLLQSNDGQLYTIQGDMVVSRQGMGGPFAPLDAEAMGEQMLATMPDNFRIHTTPHYVICYDTSREYAEWTSSLFERLYKAFTNYWKRQGMELHEPTFPLGVVVFSNRAAYEATARTDLGMPPGNIVGYYNLKTNRVNMYDLTGSESLRNGNRRGSTREINQMLSQRAAVPLVSTIVHEATHQIAFNCGLQQRLADIPLWQCEGMAVYFEAPDLSSSRGWRGIGRVNYSRLNTFRRNLPTWRQGSLKSLLADSRRFRNPQTALAAYADAWALNYFLIKYRSDEYAAYLKMLAQKPPLEEDEPQTRLAEFQEHFGDPAELERDFLSKMNRVR